MVLIDLSTAGVTMPNAALDPSAPGLAELVLGEASFGQIVTRDRMSPLHLVGGGRAKADRALLQSPRLKMTLDALLRVYDHVVLDAGTATDLPAQLLTADARGVLVPDAVMTADAQTMMAEQLKAVGFADVNVLRGVPTNGPSAPRVVAA